MKPGIRSRLLKLIDGASRLAGAASTLRDELDTLHGRRDELDRQLVGAQWLDPRRAGDARPYRRERDRIAAEITRLQGELSAAVTIANEAVAPVRLLAAQTIEAPLVTQFGRSLENAHVEELRRLVLTAPEDTQP